jgi:hypothetical protein
MIARVALCCQLIIHDLNTKQWKRQLKNANVQMQQAVIQFVPVVTIALVSIVAAVALAVPEQ